MIAERAPEVVWTPKAFRLAAEAGAFGDSRVELRFGRIFEMGVPSTLHSLVLDLLTEALRLAFGEGWWVVSQGGMHPGNHEVSPDAMVLPGSRLQPRGRVRTASLVAEVSVSTLSDDLGEKARIYAAARVSEYWVVDVRGRRVIVHTDPYNDIYREVREYGRADRLRVGETEIPVAAFLPEELDDLDLD